MDTDPSGAVMSQLFVLIILTFINAFFAASEMAIVSVNRNHMRTLAQQGNKKAKLVEQLLDDTTNFLSTIQVAITLAGFFSSASAATGLSPYLAAFLMRLNIPFAEPIAYGAITLLLVVFNLIFGELVPKRIALQKADQVSMFSARIIVTIGKLASPIIRFLSFVTRLILRIFKMDHEHIEEMVSEEEIRSMLASGQEKGVFNETEKDMIDSIFDFDDILAQAVMTPRMDVFCIDIEDEINVYMDALMEMRYSRIPVYEGEIDHIIGILNMKDFVRVAKNVGFENVDIRPILRKPYFVPESKNIDELFRELQRSHQHIAILIDEYGGFSGIVTMEDLIEEIVGDIEDEYDESDTSFKQLDAHTIRVDGLYSLEELQDYLHVSFPCVDFETINGFLIDQLGRIPSLHETASLVYENIRFEIEGMDEKRIRSVLIHLERPNETTLEDTKEATKKEL